MRQGGGGWGGIGADGGEAEELVERDRLAGGDDGDAWDGMGERDGRRGRGGLRRRRGCLALLGRGGVDELLHPARDPAPVLLLVDPNTVDDIIVGLARGAGAPPDDQAFVEVDIPAGEQALGEVVEPLAVEDEDTVERRSMALKEEEGAFEAGLGPCAVKVAVDDRIGGRIEYRADLRVMTTQDVEVDRPWIHGGQAGGGD